MKVDDVKKVEDKNSVAPKETKEVKEEEMEEKYVHEFYFNKGL